MAWEENPRICLHMQLIAILSRTGVVIETYLMKERMQKTLSQVNGCPQRDRSETEWYGGVQTFMWMCEDNIVEVPFDKEHLFEQILSPSNLNRAYKAVMRNKGCGGIDKMSCEQLLPWLSIQLRKIRLKRRLSSL